MKAVYRITIAAMLPMTSQADRVEVDGRVGSTSPMVQGWRPYSATIQPSSAAIQGAGMLKTTAFSSQRFRSNTRLAQK